jgi:hypothetical protein
MRKELVTKEEFYGETGKFCFLVENLRSVEVVVFRHITLLSDLWCECSICAFCCLVV